MQALRFDNTFVQELPADPEAGSRVRQVHGALYSHVDPVPGLNSLSHEEADALASILERQTDHN